MHFKFLRVFNDTRVSKTFKKFKFKYLETYVLHKSIIAV